MASAEIPIWMRILVLVLSMLAGFNLLFGAVSTCVFFILPRLRDESMVEVLTSYSPTPALVAGAFGAISCPLLAMKILRGRKMKAHVLAVIVLIALALVPSPQPSLHPIF